ncbi:hypothetical protein V9T40_001345 [Parthenolecanium corni]|uniref:EGF-like domain-containing protein n=1 Tax=Parthenolecanium corni TaxID=536013 RepID=A0AAN9TCN7_9HEMI
MSSGRSMRRHPFGPLLLTSRTVEIGVRPEKWCVCDSGYTGKNCESKFVPCNPSPCENHGICKPLDSLKYECKCKSVSSRLRVGYGCVKLCNREDIIAAFGTEKLIVDSPSPASHHNSLKRELL